jgi:hypothetical protein
MDYEWKPPRYDKYRVFGHSCPLIPAENKHQDKGATQAKGKALVDPIVPTKSANNPIMTILNDPFSSTIGAP